MATSQVSQSSLRRPNLWPPDRRTERRLLWKGTAAIRILPYGPDVLGVLLDLSAGGCGVELGIGMPAEVGAQVEIDLSVHGMTLRRRGVIRNICLIRRSEPETRAGIEFVEVRAPKSEETDRSVDGLIWHLKVNS